MSVQLGFMSQENVYWSIKIYENYVLILELFVTEYS